MWTKWDRPWLVAGIVVAAVAALSVRAAAQQKPVEEAAKQEAPQAIAPTVRRSTRPGDVTKVFVLRNVGARGMAELLQVFPATITFPTYGPIPNDAIGVSAAPAVMAAIEETIKRLDVPPAHRKSVELTGYVLEALAQPEESASVPPELAGVVTQLKHTFSYASYRLLDTLIARGADGSELEVTAVGSEGQSPSAGRRTRYRLTANRVRVLTGEEGPTVSLERLRFNADLFIASGNSTTTIPVGLRADIEMRAGQRLIVGKSGTNDPANAIILVLNAAVVD